MQADGSPLAAALAQPFVARFAHVGMVAAEMDPFWVDRPASVHLETLIVSAP
jgi:hypothetical protein